MYQNVKRTCRVLFLLIKPIVLWRSRCRRRPPFLNSLLKSWGGGRKVWVVGVICCLNVLMHGPLSKTVCLELSLICVL